MTTFRRIVAVLALCLSAVAPAHASTTHNVDVANFSFSPALVQAISGDTIHFNWSSGTHTVTAYVGATFDSGTMAAGSLDITFHGGTVLYYCNIHSSVDPVTLECSGPMCGAITDKTTAPSTPTISTPADSATLSDASVRVSGSSDEGTTVDVVEQGSSVGTAVADSSGQWNFDGDFANGAHTITAQATDVNQKTSAVSSARVFHVNAVDSQPPSVAIDQSSPQIFTSGGAFTGTATDDGVVDHVDLIFTGLTGVTTVIHANCTCGTPTAAWNVVSGIPTGAFNVHAEAFDGVGLKGSSSSVLMVKA